MAVAKITLELFKKSIRYGCVYTLLHNGKKHNIGLRCAEIPHYYYLNWETLEMKIYYSIEDLFQYTKINGKFIYEYWNEIEIVKEYKTFNLDNEIEIIKNYKKSYGA